MIPKVIVQLSLQKTGNHYPISFSAFTPKLLKNVAYSGVPHSSLLLNSSKPPPIRLSSHHSSKTTSQGHRISMLPNPIVNHALILSDLSAARQSWSLCCLVSNTASSPDFALPHWQLLFDLVCWILLYPQVLNTGDLIQSHSFNKHLMLITPKFTYLAHLPLDLRYIFNCLFNIST